MAVENDCDIFHAVELGCVLSNVHAYILGEDGRAEGGCEMIFDEYFSIILDSDLVNQVHLSDWEADLRVDHLIQLLSDFFDRDQVTLPYEMVVLAYTLFEPRLTRSVLVSVGEL